MQQLGKNAACPCKSGKKYKRCCLLKGIVYKADGTRIGTSGSPIDVFINSTNKFDLLKTIGALQLLPQNHGKNARFEILAKDTLRNGATGVKDAEYNTVANFFANSFPRHPYEDPVSSFLNENIVFFGGSYTVFPGLMHHGTRILTVYLEAIFLYANELPDEYKNKIHDAVTFVLTAGEVASMNAGLKRYTFEPIKDTTIEVPTPGVLKHLKNIVTFDKNYINKLASFYHFDTKIVEEFITDSTDAGLSDFDIDNSPLLKKPFVKNGDEYIFVLPSAQISALLEFILSQAEKFDCQNQLLETFYTHQWYRIREMLYDNNWLAEVSELPELGNLKIKEGVFRFDNDKLAYVCLVENYDKEPSPESLAAMASLSSLCKERANEVIDYLRKAEPNFPFKYFTVFIGGENGRKSYFMYDRPEGENQILGIGYGDFEIIMRAKETDATSLWKFAKVYRDTARTIKIFMGIGMIDLYAAYVSNYSSLLPIDTPRGNFLFIPVGTGGGFERKVIGELDEHSILQRVDNQLLPIPVIRLRKFAPIYKEKEKSNQINLALEVFKCPIWVKNAQSNGNDGKIAFYIVEAVIFWLYKMHDSIVAYLTPFKEYEPVEFILELGEEILKDDPSVNPESPPEVPTFLVEVANSEVKIIVPNEFISSLHQPSNQPEQELMKAVLNGLAKFLEHKGHMFPSDEEITDIVQKHVAPASAKMILILNSNLDIRLDTRWKVPYRNIQESEMSLILNHLNRNLKRATPIPAKIESEKEKKELCNDIVTLQFNKTVEKLKEFDSPTLLHWLMLMYESCVQTREFREIHIPAKIACFSDFPTEVEKLVQDEEDLSHASIALRTLIEFITVAPSFGGRSANLDDIEELMAMASSIVDWGMLSDVIVMEIANVEMGLLPSERIGTSRGFANETLNAFTKAKVEADIFRFQEEFAEKFVQAEQVAQGSPSDEVKQINDACEEEFGISLSYLLKIMYALINIAVEKEESVPRIEVSELIKLLEAKIPEIASDKVAAGIEFLTLGKRKSILKVPKGFENSDVYPWKYNRALSYLDISLKLTTLFYCKLTTPNRLPFSGSFSG